MSYFPNFHEPLLVCTALAKGYCVTSSLPNITCLQAFWSVDRQNVRYSFEPLAKKVTDSLNGEELAAASAYVDPEQLPVPPTPGAGPQQELDWCVFVCVGISLIDKSTHWAWMRVFPSSYHITSFKIKWYLSVHGSPMYALGSPICGLC